MCGEREGGRREREGEGGREGGREREKPRFLHVEVAKSSVGIQSIVIWAAGGKDNTHTISPPLGLLLSPFTYKHIMVVEYSEIASLYFPNLYSSSPFFFIPSYF